MTSCMSAHTDPVCARIAQHIEARLGVPTEFEIELSWAERMQLLRAGQIHCGWICGLPYVMQRDHQPARFELLAAPVMQGARYGGEAIYFADILVNRQSPFQTFADLEGASWAYNEKASFSGYLVVQYFLALQGLTLDFFRSLCLSGTHLASLAMLHRQQADCAAIDSTVLDMEHLQNTAWLEQLRAVATLGPYPIPPWVISTGVPEGLRRDLRAVLLEMHLDRSGQPALELGSLHRFIEPNDRSYDAIQEVYQAVSSGSAS